MTMVYLHLEGEGPEFFTKVWGGGGGGNTRLYKISEKPHEIEKILVKVSW